MAIDIIQGQPGHDTGTLDPLQITAGSWNGCKLKLRKALYLAQQDSYSQARSEFLCSKASFDRQPVASSEADWYLNLTIIYLDWARNDPEKGLNINDMISWVCTEARSRLGDDVDVKAWIQTRILACPNLISGLPDNEPYLLELIRSKDTEVEILSHDIQVQVISNGTKAKVMYNDTAVEVAAQEEHAQRSTSAEISKYLPYRPGQKHWKHGRKTSARNGMKSVIGVGLSVGSPLLTHSTHEQLRHGHISGNDNISN
jgi:hypothetical protein